MKALNIKRFRVLLQVLADDGRTYEINFDGTQGEFTREDWKLKDEIVSLFDSESQEEILNALEMTSNEPFFLPE